jgi:hypothetical protein
MRFMIAVAVVVGHSYKDNLKVGFQTLCATLREFGSTRFCVLSSHSTHPTRNGEFDVRASF